MIIVSLFWWGGGGGLGRWNRREKIKEGEEGGCGIFRGEGKRER